MALLPSAPLDLEPGLWPELILGTSTVLLEAEAEPDLGKLAVAWVIRNRMDRSKVGMRAAILGRDELADGDGKAFEAFSCWNDDYKTQRRDRLTKPPAMIWETCWRAMSIANWKLAPDPTHGSTFYLNPELTLRIRPDHKLPSWYNAARVKLRVGNHEFLID